MMKQSIEWHRMSLCNRIASAATKRMQAERELREVETAEREINLSIAQMELATKEGKDGYDRDKYAIKRLCI
jgi:hypothetical protein